jgi:O-antigen ligase
MLVEKGKLDAKGRSVAAACHSRFPDRVWASRAMLRAARLFAGLVIITLPWRQRLLLAERPYAPVYPDFTDLLAYTHDLLLLGVLLTWASSLLLSPRRLHLGPLFLRLPLLGLLAASALSLIASPYRGIASSATVHLFLATLFYGFLINEVGRTSYLFWAFAVQVGVQAMVGIGQAWTQSDMGLGLLGERSLAPTAGAAVVSAGTEMVSLRSFGLSDHPNILAIHLTLGTLFGISWCLSTSTRFAAPVALLLAMTSVALLLSFSRPIHAILIVSMVGMLLIRRAMRLSSRKGSARLLGGIIMLMLLPVAWINRPFLTLGTTEEEIRARVQERIDSREQRRTLNERVNRLFVKNALIGTGLGTVPVALRDSYPALGYDYQPAPVTLIDAAAELGLLGAASFFFLLSTPWVALAFHRNRLGHSAELAGMSGLLLVSTLVGFRDAYFWFYPSGRLAQWMIWALWGVAYMNARRSSATQPREKNG